MTRRKIEYKQRSEDATEPNRKIKTGRWFPVLANNPLLCYSLHLVNQGFQGKRQRYCWIFVHSDRREVASVSEVAGNDEPLFENRNLK